MHASEWHSLLCILLYLPCAPKAVLQGKLMSIFVRPLVQLDQKMIAEDELLVRCSCEHQSSEQEESQRCPISTGSQHRAVFTALLESERCRTQRNAGALQRDSSGRISQSSGDRACVWDPICMFCLPLIYNSTARLHVTFHGEMPNKLKRVWLIASLPPSVVCMK